MGGFNDMAGIAFQAAKLKKSCTSETLYISTKSLMTYDESHCQATKRPKRGVVNARYLWVEGLTTFGNSLYHAAKMPNRGSVNIMGGGTHAPSGILQSTE
jgi:hypothetical protein